MFHEVAWILGIFACRWRKLPDPGRHLSKKNSPMQQPFNWMACNSSLCNAGAYPRLELRKRISSVKYYVYWITIVCNNDCLLGGMSVLHSYIIGCFITIREGKPKQSGWTHTWKLQWRSMKIGKRFCCWYHWGFCLSFMSYMENSRKNLYFVYILWQPPQLQEN